MEIPEIEKLLHDYGSLADLELKKFIPQEAEGLIGKNLNEPIWYHMGTGGKRIRPAFCLLTCEALGGKKEGALPFAVAVELLHNMLLLHDDIEDGDRIRRDSPTVWVKYGVPNAVNAGDYMVGKAYDSILRSGLPDKTKLKLIDIFTLTYIRTGEGQALDINYRASPDFRIEDYLQIAELKTAYYLVFALVGGAIVAGASDKVIEKIWALGKNLGPAFQIRDDIIDLTVGKGRGGEIGCDIREGKPSILFAHALSKANPADKSMLVKVMAKPRDETTKEDIEWAIRLYKRTGSMDFAQEYAEKLIKDAFEVIDAIPLRNKQVFKDIALYIAERSK
ncbi:MAG: polyprenyl synthetase family protein [archaeon]